MELSFVLSGFVFGVVALVLRDVDNRRVCAAISLALTAIGLVLAAVR